MGKFNFDIDEAAILKAYRISSLDPPCVASHNLVYLLPTIDAIVLVVSQEMGRC